jgi:four helix bundle protein
MASTTGLRALDAAQILVKEILEAVESFPAHAPAALRRQLADSANSVIAEGFGRGTNSEKRYRMRIARGSLEETQSHLKVSRMAGHVDQTRFFRIWNLSMVLNRMLSRLIRRSSERA